MIYKQIVLKQDIDINPLMFRIIKNERTVYVLKRNKHSDQYVLSIVLDDYNIIKHEYFNINSNHQDFISNSYILYVDKKMDTVINFNKFLKYQLVGIETKNNVITDIAGEPLKLMSSKGNNHFFISDKLCDVEINENLDYENRILYLTLSITKFMIDNNNNEIKKQELLKLSVETKIKEGRINYLDLKDIFNEQYLKLKDEFDRLNNNESKEIKHIFKYPVNSLIYKLTHEINQSIYNSNIYFPFVFK